MFKMGSNKQDLSYRAVMRAVFLCEKMKMCVFHWCVCSRRRVENSSVEDVCLVS